MEVKTVHEGAGNRAYNAAERQTVRYRRTGSWDCLYMQTCHGFTSGMYSLLLLFADDGWRGIATITDRQLYLINNILKEDYKT